MVLARNSDREWEQLGKDDPYFGVVSMDKFRKDRMDNEAKDAFFKSGEDHVDYVLRTIREQMVPDFKPSRALDFGCGVGRLTLPLAAKAGQVMGVDVSDSMLEEARRNAAERRVTNIEWRNPGPDLSTLEGEFDLIHSFIVFQHIPPVRGLPIVEQMIEHLRPDGVASLQFLYYRDVPRIVKIMGWLRKHIPGFHNLVNLAYGKPLRDPLMEKNCYDLNRLLFLLHTSGCGNIHIHLQGKGKLKSAVVFFQKTPDAVPYDAFYEAT